MDKYEIILEKYKGKKTRHKCPNCGAKGEFTRYIKVLTGEYIADHVGRCNRESSCGYHVTPKEYYKENPREHKATAYIIEPIQPVKIDFLPDRYIDRCADEKFYNRNNFYIFLSSLFTELVAKDLSDTYCIGTSSHWKGSVVFPQIDAEFNLRQLKIMLHNPTTGKRVKPGMEVEKWDKKTKSYIRKNDENCSKVYGKWIDDYTKTLHLQQCFFGEHLLSIHRDKPVCVVESEKTAIIASVYLPGFIWLATGGASGCMWTEYAVYKVLKGRSVTFFPDYGQFKTDKTCYHEWNDRCKRIREAIPGTKIKVSDVLEKRLCKQERKDQDLADLLVDKDEQTGIALSESGYPIIWDYPLNGRRAYMK